MSAVKKDLSPFDSKLDLNNLDKSNWKTYRFDEIAKNISERVDPNNTDLKIYIGLEHIDSESLHIRRSGTPDDVNGTKLKFYKGDIIFGRRRAYQRKAGIATWDGFCSAHALVLRANPDVIVPELFPFFLHSDLFMHRAVDISVGSLSPTINWGTLKHQEFIIPPKHQQAQIAEICQSMDDSILKNIELSKKVTTLEEVIIEQVLSAEVQLKVSSKVTNFIPPSKEFLSSWSVYELAHLCNKVTDGEHLSPTIVQSGHPIISAKDITHNTVDLSEAKYLTHEAFVQSRKRCDPEYDDVLIVSRGATIGRTTVNKNREHFALMGSVILLKPNSKVLGDFLGIMVKRKKYQATLLAISGSTAQQAIYLADIKKSKLNVPPLSYQKQVIDTVFKIRVARDNAIAKVTSAKKLASTILTKVF